MVPATTSRTARGSPNFRSHLRRAGVTTPQRGPERLRPGGRGRGTVLRGGAGAARTSTVNRKRANSAYLVTELADGKLPGDWDLYRVLQVDSSADPEVIEAAYKRLALKYHPD